MNAPLLARTMWITVMAMITGTAVGGLLMAHQGLFALFVGEFKLAAARVAVGAGLGAAAYLLCRYRNDLLDDAGR